MVALDAGSLQPGEEVSGGLVGELGPPGEPGVLDGGQHGGREDGEHVGAPRQAPRPVQPLVGVVGAAADEQAGQHRQGVPGQHPGVRVAVDQLAQPLLGHRPLPADHVQQAAVRL